MKTILFIFGTRPEAIKLAPLITAIKVEQQRGASRFRPVVCVTAQHRQMLDQVLGLFGITPDHDLDLMTPNQSLSTLTGKCLQGLEPVIAATRPDWVVVQGDTTTVLGGALSAFYAKVRVAHVEAGLRTHQKYRPFPEEINRRLTSALADAHFAPTASARENLLREGIPAERVFVTGNTVIDALFAVREMAGGTGWESYPQLAALVPVLSDDRVRVILVTGHRRENFGQGFQGICEGIRSIALRYPDCRIVYPVHLNPNVREPVARLLGTVPNVHLIEPLDYLPFAKLMDRSYLLLTDSGGIQEEGPALGKPVLVMRTETERPEAVAAGTVKLVGTDSRVIAREVARLMDDGAEYEGMSRAINPYGDGKASGRILDVLAASSDGYVPGIGVTKVQQKALDK